VAIFQVAFCCTKWIVLKDHSFFIYIYIYTYIVNITWFFNHVLSTLYIGYWIYTNEIYKWIVKTSNLLVYTCNVWNGLYIHIIYYMPGQIYIVEINKIYKIILNIFKIIRIFLLHNHPYFVIISDIQFIKSK